MPLRDWLYKDDTAEVIEHSDEHSVAIIYRVDPNPEHSGLEFIAVECTPQGDGTYIYDDGDNGWPTTPDTAVRFVEGWVKGDGCSHLNFGEKDWDGYLHLCGGGCYARVAYVLRRVQELATTVGRVNPEYSGFV